MSTNFDLTHPNYSHLMRLAIIVTGIMVSAIVIITCFSTIIWLLVGPGSLFSQKAHGVTSPNGRYEILISRRVNFPVFDPMAPSTSVTIELKKDGMVEATDFVDFEIHEYQELLEPEVIWTSTHVTLDKIESHDTVQITYAYQIS